MRKEKEGGMNWRWWRRRRRKPEGILQACSLSSWLSIEGRRR